MVGSRYSIEAELGRGGMARVYRVREERTGQQFALKKLTVTGHQSSTLRAMFEHEFHTLSQLAHPNIIRVFDYGLDGEDPYYTMELLAGSDARVALKESSFSVREICSLLRDCASALALIHSRRMVHRDIGPRNVWCTPERRGKLIDFGTLVAMGLQSRIAGTPPFVPPEALYMQPLDARCDLYALGALAYFLLTGEYAYPARSLAELPTHWQTKPKRPDAIDARVPGALSDLVMALLSYEARARPATAAEVYERLSGIGRLAVEEQREAAQAFLSTPLLVGRNQATGEVTKSLARLLGARGSTLAIVGPQGSGRTRMLAQSVLQAKLSGAVTLRVDATAVGSDPLSVVTSLAEQLVEARPMLAATSMELGPVLGHLSPALHEAFGTPALAELPGLQRSSKLSAAIVQLFDTASAQQRVIAAIDDVHRADNASLGVLGRLALLAANHRLLVITTCESGSLDQPPPALAQLVQTPRRIELTALTAAQMRELLESIFGAIAGLDSAAMWIHELTSGNPQACMQYAQFLVDQGVARYERECWTLPAQLRELGLPQSLEAMLDRRVAALSSDARALALGLALARDESRSSWQPELHVRFEDFPTLLEAGDPARASAALDELLRTGILQQRNAFYVLAQRAMVDALIRTAPQETRDRTHGRLASIFTAPGYKSSWLAIRHMLSAGDQLGARRAVLAFAAHGATRAPDWGAMRVSLHALCSREAVDHWEAEHGRPIEGIILRRVLLTAVAVYDWRLASYGDAQLAQLRADCGWNHWDETDPTSPASERAAECLKRAEQAYATTPEERRGLSPRDAARELASSSLLLARAHAASFDIERTRDLQPALEALRPVSEQVALMADLCRNTVDRVTGRDLADRVMEVTGRLLQSTEFPELLRRASAGLNIHEQALEDARIGRKRALQLIDLITFGGGSDDLFIVLHGRWLGYGFLGDAERARALRKRAEIITEDDVWRHKAYLWVEAEYYSLTGNLHALHRIEEQLAQLASLFPGHRPWLAYVRASISRLRGEPSAAKSLLAAALNEARPGEHRAWIVLAPAYVEVLLLCGDAETAEREATSIVQQVRSLGLQRSCEVSAQRLLALASSKQQRHAAAKEAMAQALTLARELDFGGLALAQLHEARARVALSADDVDECIHALGELWALIEPSEAAELVARYESLREEAEALRPGTKLPAISAVGSTATIESSSVYTEVKTLLMAVGSSKERATEVLQLLLQDAAAAAGHLMLLNETGLYLAVSVGDEPASDELMQKARDHFEAKVAATTDLVENRNADGVPTFAHGALQLTPVPLVAETRDGQIIAGIAILVLTAKGTRVARPELVRVVTQCLLTAGDTVAVVMDE
jgi:hypothetical protein